VAAFSGSHRFVLDYLADEVLDGQPGQVRAFLLETSVLARLSGELCDAVTGRAGSQAMLQDIERAGLFLVPLDEVRGWWRYHHLFADLLRARLQAEQPGRVQGCTGPRPPGARSMTWPMTRCGTRWRPGTPPGRRGWWSGTSRPCSAAARA
jgi:ATP-dependent transcriptional regulator